MLYPPCWLNREAIINNNMLKARFIIIMTQVWKPRSALFLAQDNNEFGDHRRLSPIIADRR